jgi:hypothetical protein
MMANGVRAEDGARREDGGEWREKYCINGRKNGRRRRNGCK